MAEIDNDVTLTETIIKETKRKMENFLVRIPKGERITFGELYDELGVKYTKEREGSLDALISDTLVNWNWRHRTSGLRGELQFIDRRWFPGEPSNIEMLDGVFFEETESWPPYAPHRPRDDKELEALRAKVRTARQQSRHAGQSGSTVS